ncbi:N-acetylmuramoyl-L-alanine amidase [candidate division KSB1 bacterium]|nr:N-acetylmuramoyl-L-alanine amidase [candidate division KSB1 bacterium]
MRQKILILLIVLMTTALWSQTDLAGLKFCIDPGHGAYPTDKPFETRINQRVANFLQDYLVEYGTQVYLTRKDSTASVSLSQREAIANRNNVDFFLSIHHNAFNGKANYTAVFFQELSNGRPRWGGAADVMSSIMADYLYKYLYTTAGYARGDLPFLGFNLGVLNDLTMPGVLTEASFWDYVPEVHRLNALKYLKLEAYALIHSFLNYYEVPKNPVNWVEGVVQDADGQKLKNISVHLTNGIQEMSYKTDSQNIGITAQDNSWGGFPYVAEVKNGMYFFENFPLGPAQLIFEGEKAIRDTIDIVIKDSTSNRLNPVILISAAPPVVEFSFPKEADRRKVPTNSPLVFTFSKPMNRERLIQAFKISPAVDSLNFKFYENDTQFRIYVVPSYQFWTEYTVTLDGSVACDRWNFLLDGDFNGNYGGNFTAHFRTRSQDQTPPQIMSRFPNVNDSTVAIETAVAIEFNELLAPETVNDQNITLMAAEKLVPCQISYFETGMKSYVFMMPDTVLESNQRYDVRVSSRVTDIYENQLRSTIPWQFKTRKDIYTVENIENFEAGLEYWKLQDTIPSTLSNGTALGISDSITFSMLGSRKSARLDYAWDPEAVGHLFSIKQQFPIEIAPKFTTDQKLQIFIYGDGAGNYFRFSIRQPESSLRIVNSWIPIDWYGWRSVEWDLSQDTLNFPAENPALKGPFYVESLQFGFNGENAALSGTLYFDNISIIKPLPTALEPIIGIPLQNLNDFVLYQNFPNPFNNQTVITYRLNKPPDKIDLVIFNSLGQKIRIFQNLATSPGVHHVRWDGFDDRGQAVAAGIYFCEFRADGRFETRKISLTK